MQKKTQAWRQARTPFKPSLQLPELRTYGQRIAKIVDGVTTERYLYGSSGKLLQVSNAPQPAAARVRSEFF